MKQNTRTIRNTLFPRRIIINFIASAILILLLFFLGTIVVNDRAKVRNENIYKNQQILQVRMAAQAIEDNLNSIFYNIDIIQLYCRDLFTGQREMSNSFFQLVQTSKQEVAAFIVVDEKGDVRYRSFSIGEDGKAAQELILSYIDEYQSKIAGGLNYVPPLYITKDMQLVIKLVPIWRNGTKTGVIGVAVNIGSIIQKYSFVSRLGFSGDELFLDKNGTVIVDIEPGNIGRNIHDVDLEGGINTDSFPMKDILAQVSGSRKFRVVDNLGHAHNALVAWDSFKIMDEKVIVLLGASEKVINRPLRQFHRQAMALGLVVVMIMAGFSFLLIYSRRRMVSHSIKIMEETIEKRTDELMRSEKKYQAVFHGVNDGLVVLKEGKISYFNQSAANLIGYPEAELVGRNPLDFVFEAYEEGVDNAAPYREYAKEALEGKTVQFEAILMRKDGSLLYAEIGLADLEEEGALIMTMRDITLRKKAEKELYELNAQLEKRVSQRTLELEKANDALKVSLATLKETQQNLVEAGKMASLGVLVAGVAHEVNTPVGIGVTAASYLEEQTRVFDSKYRNNQMKRSDLENYLAMANDSAKVILENLHLASERISSFKQVAVDQTSQEIRKFNLKSYIEDILISIQPAYKKTKHKVVLTGDDTLSVISAPGALSQVFTNLVMNSLKHGFEGIEQGTMTIDVHRGENGVEIVYSDDGVGMTPEVVQKIYDPFFTTKRGMGGSGLGMNIVYNLVTRTLGGEIRCESSPGKGAKFYINLPWEIDKSTHI